MGNILSTNVSKQVQYDYLSYSLAALSRSIPDLYDGLIPSRRRLLQTMFEEGFLPHKPYVKCARTTGLTSAYYHPHGSAYGSLISMATPWTNNVPWVDCHGNIGSSVDGPAAERYVENRLKKAALDLLLQDSETWDTKPNYDNSRKEAIRFNSSLPTVLLNGDIGISVGYSTRLAPHNVKAVIEATDLVCKASSCVSEKAYGQKIDKARELLVPDFPTGPDIVNDDQLTAYIKTGSGGIRCRAKVSKGTQKRQGKAKDRATLTFTCLPPGVNPEKVGDQIKEGLEKGRIEGVAEINDLSDLNGDCIEVVCKPGVNSESLLVQIYSFTDLDLRYSAKTLVIDGLKPVELAPIEIIQKWVDWKLGKLQEKFLRELGIKQFRAEIVSGLLRAIDKMDAIIKKIRASKDKAEAKSALMAAPFKFSDPQAESILEMRLRQLTNLDRQDLILESNELNARIKELEVLSEGEVSGTTARRAYLTSELKKLLKAYGTERKSLIIDPPAVAQLASLPSKGSASRVVAPKPRFLKIDMKRGVVEQAKGPRGALVADQKEKIILMSEDGFLRKVPATFKGTVSNSYSQVKLAKREVEVSSKKFLVVFELDGHLKASVLEGSDLCKVTSSGKRWLPEGALLRHFGENNYTVNWVSSRKKPLELNLGIKVGKPGSKGVKIADVKDVRLEAG